MEIYKQLETEYAEWCDKKYGVALNSGTAGLHLSLIALGIGKGDEVIVPDFAFAATSFAVSYVGATPIFVDCKSDYNIDPSKIKITEKTKAIIAVHTYGRLCDMNALLSFGVPVIEDACEAHGASVGKGIVTVFSFQKSKIINTEEGGIVVTDNKEIAEKISFLKSMANENRAYFHPEIGFNYRMTDHVAGLALEQLRDIEYIFIKRRRIEKMYLDKFGGKPHDSPWVFDMISHKRDLILKEIPEARPFFKPQSSFPMYQPNERGIAHTASELGFVVNLDQKWGIARHQEIINKIYEINEY